MASDNNDKLSIKHLLFTKAIPNYIIPVPTAGYKTYPCIDCGDRFIFQSSYEYHINRQSVVITYMCRHCNRLKTFNNRCKLLSHIRSHAFKTATINVSDLKVDPLPASYFDNLAVKHGALVTEVNNSNNTDNNTEVPLSQPSKPKKPSKLTCLECNQEILVTSLIYKDRAKHFMQYTNKVHACPVCLFALPTKCGLKAHIRIHAGTGPFICPECGITLTKRMIQYPYTHDCEGFRMMRATARYRCPLPRCYLFHPNEYKSHMRNHHLKRVYKCPMCVVACFNEITIAKHLKSHDTEAKALIFFQCEMCPGRLVLHNQMDNHLRGHITNSAFVYPCWACGQVFRVVRNLLQHYSNNHGPLAKLTAPSDGSSTPTTVSPQKDAEKPDLIYRVVKRCDKCKRSFTYKCKYEQISILPNECPFKCTASGPSQDVVTETPPASIKCHLCKKDVSEKWEDIKSHYASEHKNYRCLDAKLVLKKINVKKYKRKQKREARKRLRNAFKSVRGNKKSRNLGSSGRQAPNNETAISSSNPLVCKKCGYEGQDTVTLQEHWITHRDSNMAYQCMECGQCFVVKPSFTTHLLIEHGIADVDEYIALKQCHNADALLKNNFTTDIVKVEDPLRENQCQICRDEFDDPGDLEKHFRVHGMAFLMKNSSAKNNSP